MKVCCRASSASSSLAEHAPAEGEQAAVIAVEDELEGPLVAGAHAGHEGVVGPPARQAQTRARRRERRARVRWWRAKRPRTRALHILSNARIRRGLEAGGDRSARRLSCETPMPFFRHEGSRLAYTIYGDGPRTFVLVHGLLLSQKMHRPLARALAERGNRVVTLDLLGHGRSDRPQDMTRYSMPFFGEQMIALLDHLERRRGRPGRDVAGRQRDARGGGARPRARPRHGRRDAGARQRAARAARSPSRR